MTQSNRKSEASHGGETGLAGGGAASAKSTPHYTPSGQENQATWATFPVIPDGKQPACKWSDESRPGYQRDGYNVGLDCGKSGLVVLDLDRHDGKADGVEAYAELKAELGIDDSGALVSKTPGGGYHIIWSDPTGGLIGNSNRNLPDGMDVRANGGYVVIPPSSIDGKPYQWRRNGFEPEPLPPQLVKILLERPEPKPEPEPKKSRRATGQHARRYALAAMDDEAAALASTAPGGRNERANRSAYALGQFVGAGALDRAEVERVLYNACVDNGLVSDDGKTSVEKTIKSGLDAGEREPRRIPEQKPSTRATGSQESRREPAAAKTAEADGAVGAEGAEDAGNLTPTALIEQVKATDDADKLMAIWRELVEFIAPMDAVARDRWIDAAAKTGKVTKSTLRKQLKREGESRDTLQTEDYIELYGQWGFTFALNECNDSVELNGERARDIDADVLKARVRDYGIANNVSVNVSHALEAVTTNAEANSYHPIKGWLEGLEWDGHNYIGKLASFFTTKHDDFERWLKHWLVGAVARVYEGFQTPMLVLVGKQEVGKSFFASWLCPREELFYRGAIQPDSKDCRLRRMTKFVWEVEELGSTTRRQDVEALKAFLTQERVQDRKPYGHFDLVKPVMSSYIGTVNPSTGFLVDTSGNRRFVVCEVEAIDWDYAKDIDANDVWSQAMALYQDSEDDWQLTEEDKLRRDSVNEEHQIDDPVHNWLALHSDITDDDDDYVSLDTLRARLDTHFKLSPRALSMAISSFYAQHDGVHKERRMVDGTRARFYFGVKLLPNAKTLKDGEATDAEAERARKARNTEPDL